MQTGKLTEPRGRTVLGYREQIAKSSDQCQPAQTEQDDMSQYFWQIF